jgi:hypothetical protein
MYSTPFIIEVLIILFLIGIEIFLGYQTYFQLRVYKNTFQKYPLILSGRVPKNILKSGDGVSIIKHLNSENILIMRTSKES